jgi:hypothetical protein
VTRRSLERLGSWLSFTIETTNRTAMNSDFKELLKIFNDNQVKYLIVGGYAVMSYRSPAGFD